MNAGDTATPIDAVDRQLILATQGGIPLTPRPYHAIAKSLGLDPERVMARLARMQDAGIVRRIGAIPNHYRIGFRANGMSVWDVEDGRLPELGPQVGALDFVSHCYHRPRRPPDWPYNLFAMVHGHCREEVEAQVERISGILGERQRAHDVLYSKRILKKTGMRLNGGT